MDGGQWTVSQRYRPPSTAHRLFFTVTTPPGNAPPPEQEAAPRLRWLRAAVPHIATALVAVAVTLAIGSLWVRPAPVAVSFPTTAPQPTVVVTPAPPSTPAPTPLPLSAGVARQEIADLQAEDSRLWTTVYLLKAVNQVAEAEGALQTNDMSSVDQSLIATDYALSLAYSRAEEASKSPIDQFRRNVDRIRGDLYLYPERMDTRLAQLRQLLLALIDEPK